MALAREAARRALGQRPFDEQVLAGLALAKGRIVEMATGEGKTLAAVAPVFLHALAGRGAHVLTFNDYLARRDAGWMGPVYERLGLRVGFVQERMSVAERQRAYAADVTYLTAKEAGFDHLRDGLALEPGDRVQRELPLRARRRGRLHPDRRGAHPARHRGRDGGGARRAAEARRPRAGPRAGPRLRHGPARAQHRPHRGGHRAGGGGTRPRRPPRARERVSPRAAAPRAARRAPAAARRGLHRAGRDGSSSSTSRPAASPRGATGPTACTRRSRPRRACGSPPRAASWARSRSSTSSASTRASPA